MCCYTVGDTQVGHQAADLGGGEQLCASCASRRSEEMRIRMVGLGKFLKAVERMMNMTFRISYAGF